MARQVLENGVILPAEYSDDWYDDMTSNLTKLDDVIGSDSEKLSSSDVGAAALSNNYNDLDNLPTIPTVNDAALTIQKNGVDVQTFTANASSNVTCNITVPTKTSDLTNDSNFVDTSNAAVSSGITSAKVTDYDTHIADTDIHVTTADKNKWNNQTYVFRYSSTALVASSTNSNALLDNTDNLKVGDKVIDSSGVLFSITAIDTANSTFTIGTALIDLAQDSDVVHKSGNETVGGAKTFTDNNMIKTSSPKVLLINTSQTGNTPPSSNTASFFRFDGGTVNNFGGVQCEFLTTGENRITQYVKDITTAKTNSIQQRASSTTAMTIFNTDLIVPATDGITVLGNSSKRWSDVQTYKVNNLEPSSLSMPDLDNGIDISSYLDTSQSSINYYTPPVNGWISIKGRSSSSNGLAIIQGDFAQDSQNLIDFGNTNRVTFCALLVKAGVQVEIWLKSVTTLDSAKFFPCLGNV